MAAKTLLAFEGSIEYGVGCFGVAELLCQLEFACVAVNGLDEEVGLTVDMN